VQLDTHVRNLLDMLANSEQPKIWELPPADARNMALAIAQMVEGKKPIGKVENGSLPGAGGTLPFRMYTPASIGAEPPACIVYFHGGAWIFGNLDTHDCMCRMLANASGCRVISIDYRLAPENKFPAGVEDAIAATKWVAAKASDIGIDPLVSSWQGILRVVIQLPLFVSRRKREAPKLLCRCYFTPSSILVLKTNRASILLRVTFLKDL
jgi:acetyl esterase